MATAMRRDEQPWIVGAVLGTGAVLVSLVSAVLGRRSAQETEYYRSLGIRVGALEKKVDRLEAELDTERQEVLRLTAERDGLKRENVALTERCAELSARNLELEHAVAQAKRH